MSWVKGEKNLKFPNIIIKYHKFSSRFSFAVETILFFLILSFQLLQRMTKVETNVTLLLQWVACLNGNMGTEKEFRDFLKKLKKKYTKTCG